MIIIQWLLRIFLNKQIFKFISYCVVIFESTASELSMKLFGRMIESTPGVGKVLLDLNCFVTCIHFHGFPQILKWISA